MVESVRVCLTWAPSSRCGWIHSVRRGVCVYVLSLWCAISAGRCAYLFSRWKPRATFSRGRCAFRWFLAGSRRVHGCSDYLLSFRLCLTWSGSVAVSVEASASAVALAGEVTAPCMPDCLPIDGMEGGCEAWCVSSDGAQKGGGAPSVVSQEPMAWHKHDHLMLMDKSKAKCKFLCVHYPFTWFIVSQLCDISPNKWQ